MDSKIQYASVNFSSHRKVGDLTLVNQISNSLSKYLLTSSQKSQLYFENRYQHAYSIVSNEVMLLKFKIRHPALVRLMNSLGWFFFGCILILVFFRKRMLFASS